ncbi:Vps54-domain-containing protein [Coniophora puteana RWD-64-598 SS2]|uniref:Vps54-domain-containing protein n=1 Tax=Coniophora puteana (strain RWD-64-598) TaxID=741705 RepID=A0A5M3N0I6_CONPW|nr:Vps54-domain-containing protein [Coniophora puteana RWD-64-598 SS2]EIW84920.1 Vps54-domain-containing protein [Coniophora puteana RWD-64-598 SS2]
MSDYTSSPSRPASPVGALPDTQTITPRPFRFNWDTASRVRGPGSVSEATEGRGADYFGVAPRLDPFGASSSNLTAGSLPNEWSSSKQGFNAISTVLNNPHRKQAPPKAHSSLPAVPPADLPRVKRKDFDSYLRAVGPEWDKFQRNLQPDVDDQTRPEQSSTTPRSSLNTPHTPVSTKPFTPLNSVPQIFFDPHFNLGDPRTFGVVTERGNAEEDADPLLPSYALPLLERLSHHADTIEQHLVREISARSSSFFAALSNLQDLQTESEECLDRVSKLRGLLNDVDEKGAKRGLHIVTRQSKQRNLAAVHEGIKEVESVVEMTGVAKGLVVAGQWGEALGIIEDVEALWDPRPLKPPLPLSRKNSRQSLLSNGNGRLSPLPPTPESPPPETDAASVTRFSNASIPLSSLQAFSSLPDQLRTLTMEIASSLTTDLVTALKLDLRERATFTPEAPVDEVTLKDRLRPLLQGLSRTKGLREATISWREIVNLEMRGIIGQHLPSLEFDEDELKSPKTPPNGASTHLRGLSYEDSMHLVSALYRSTVNALSGLQTQNSTFTDVLSGLESRYSIDIPSIREELADIMSSAADLVNKILAKLIGYRADQHAQLELPQFLTFFNESWSFVVTCETICRRMIMGLRGTLLGQAKTFLQTFHQARISQSARLVEDEQWSQTEVAPSLQQLVGILVDSAVRDSPELIIKPVTASASPSSPVNGSASPSPKANGPGASSKYLHIEEHPFFCVSATGAVLALLLDYLKVVVNLSVLNTDTMSRVIEFLKAFNSRTCQVVLGAGAMRSAGLRNITAKHLALASQSLSIMVMLIPYVRETFRRHLSQTQAVMLVEFDKLKRDFQEHQNEIHSKLIAIMSDRISAHVKSLQAVDWTVPKEGANSYMELLVKETVTLYKVLSRYLTTQVVEVSKHPTFGVLDEGINLT